MEHFFDVQGKTTHVLYVISLPRLFIDKPERKNKNSIRDVCMYVIEYRYPRYKESINQSQTHVCFLIPRFLIYVLY